jgi:hypothetical protein
VEQWVKSRSVPLFTVMARLRVAPEYRNHNALAESDIGLFKSDVIHHSGPWHNLEQVEYATLEWVHWFKIPVGLPEPIGNIPPAEFELIYIIASKTSRHRGLIQRKPSPGIPGRFTMRL